MIRIFKPKEPGTFVRDPFTMEKLPPEGKAIRLDSPAARSFWNRRLADGSVVEVLPEPEKKVVEKKVKNEESDK